MTGCRGTLIHEFGADGRDVDTENDKAEDQDDHEVPALKTGFVIEIG